jgi:hypothetical protein
VRNGDHEIGIAPPRGRPKLDRDNTNRKLTAIAGQDIHLPDGAIVTGGPATCPACGSGRVEWAVFAAKGREAHPVVWHDTEWLADSFICMECNAGWVEPDDPEPITWVRPYWLG